MLYFLLKHDIFIIKTANNNRNNYKKVSRETFELDMWNKEIKECFC